MVGRRADAIGIGLAGLMGAAGVMLAAAGAHVTSGVGLDTAANMLLFHASAVLALVALLDRSLVWRPLGLLAAFALVLGASLFAGDLACRAFAQTRLFPMAAPIGGTILIGGWLVLALAAVLPAGRR